MLKVAKFGGSSMADAGQYEKVHSIVQADPARRVVVVKNEQAEDRLTLLRAPRLETNKGRDPKSRRFIRGVLHTHPVSIYFGAIVTLMLAAIIPIAVVAAVITPPDVISQVGLALPLILLYEISILFAAWMTPKPPPEETA